MFGLNVSGDICLVKTGLVTEATEPLLSVAILVRMLADETVQLFISQGHSFTWKYSVQMVKSDL